MDARVRQVFEMYDRLREPPDELQRYCPACGGGLVGRIAHGRTRAACPACGYVHYRNPATAVSVLIADGDRFVLCRRSDRAFLGGLWCLPCGYVDFEEDFLSAARREVLEETGLVVEVEAILTVCSNLHSPKLHTLVTTLLARPVGGELRAGDDVVDARWVSVADELPSLAFDADAHIIERYFATRLPGAPVEVS